MTRSNKNTKSYKILTTVLIIILMILFTCIFLLYSIFRYNSYLYASIISFILFAIVFYLHLSNSKIEDLKDLLELNEVKMNLLTQKNNIQKDYLKRKIIEKEYLEKISKLDSQILDLEFEINFFHMRNSDDIKRINSMISIIDNKYLKKEISEEVFKKRKQELIANLERIKKKNS